MRPLLSLSYPLSCGLTSQCVPLCALPDVVVLCALPVACHSEGPGFLAGNPMVSRWQEKGLDKLTMVRVMGRSDRTRMLERMLGRQ